MDDFPPLPQDHARMQRPNVLYSIINEKAVAGFDALLCSEQAVAPSILEYLSLNRVVLGNGAFCLIAAKVTQGANSHFENLMEANGCFANRLEEELLQRTIYHMLPLRGLVICCISMPQFTEAVDGLYRREANIHEYCTNAITACHQEADLNVLVAVSPISFGTESLAGSFRCTVDLLQMHAFLGQTDGLCTDTSPMPARNIYFFLELEQACSMAEALLQNQDYTGFQANVLRQVRALAQIRPYALSIFHANCYRYLDLLCCRLAQAGQMDAKLLERTDLWGLVQRAESLIALEGRLTALLDRLTASFRKKWGGADQTRICEMQQYMQTHIADSTLSVSSMAEQFGMSQPVFSAYYKKHTGTSPLEYMTQLRVDRAKHLLRTTDCTLSEIAEQAGFGSISSLHRVFKAKTGITPAKLRPEKP